MCGLFGFVSHGSSGPNIKTLQRIAVVTERRGNHAYGWSWIDHRGRMRYYKRPGKISLNLRSLEMLKDARMVIAHCRYATHGHPEVNSNNHPHPADSGWIVHNGKIGNFQIIASQLGLRLSTQCDSEVLAAMIEHFRGPVFERCVRAVSMVPPNAPFAMLGLWPRPMRMVMIRRGHPLNLSETERGYYIASLPTGMPGMPVEIENGTAFMFDQRKRVKNYATVC